MVKHAEAHTVWGHRNVWAMTGYEGEQVSTVLRVLHRSDLCRPVDYTHERRQFAGDRKAAFMVPSDAPNQMWHLDYVIRTVYVRAKDNPIDPVEILVPDESSVLSCPAGGPE